MNILRSTTLRAVPVTQPIGTFYAGSMNAYTLLDMCEFDFRRIQETGGYRDFLGIQRQLDQNRVKEIARYVTTIDAVFPTAIVISVDGRCVKVRDIGDGSVEIKLSEYVDEVDPELRIEFRDIATIIDGQHRLKAFELVSNLPFDLNVAIFVDIDDATEAEIFSTVNLAQTKVNRSLVYDLFSLKKSRSPERTCHEIVVALNSLATSPFYQKIKRLGTATEGVFGETLKPL